MNPNGSRSPDQSVRAFGGPFRGRFVEVVSVRFAAEGDSGRT